MEEEEKVGEVNPIEPVTMVDDNRSSRITRESANDTISGAELIQDEEDVREPNAFVSNDPKPIFIKLTEYCQDKEMMFEYRKNSHKIRLFIPLNSR